MAELCPDCGRPRTRDAETYAQNSEAVCGRGMDILAQMHGGAFQNCDKHTIKRLRARIQELEAAPTGDPATFTSVTLKERTPEDRANYWRQKWVECFARENELRRENARLATELFRATDARPKCIECGRRWVPDEDVDATVTCCKLCKKFPPYLPRSRRD